MFIKFRVIDGKYIVTISRVFVKHVNKVILSYKYENKTNHPISSNSHPSTTAIKAIIITDSVVLWKIHIFESLIPETK